ncbi:hypothetical protein BGHDH14_bgh00283 [Blumeria hordei DH14]|uniref:2-dehydropantoate 2-reductase n=1 Tax=Blumeria graminis f. sp. hordei (strain DH14) TaxID=546991 RepID=N1JDE1_BLUG1|nr:hypothetical protein BGHDH14_bgh00283 [Blumeria hordei DH14]
MSSIKPIHVLGLGNLGRFIAHSLHFSQKIAPPIHLLFHRQSLWKEWEEASCQIRVTSNDLDHPSRSTTTSSSIFNVEPTSAPVAEFGPIHNLILTTKSHRALEALRSVKHRIVPDTTILFVQNGLGAIELANAELFPDPCKRPQYLAALVTHGLFATAPFHSVHASPGAFFIGHISTPSPATLSLVKTLKATSSLNVTYYESTQLRTLQIEKLIANAVINPLSALFRCPNGQLFWVGVPRILVKNLMKKIVSEIHRVLQKTEVLEGRIDPDRFSQINMETMVTGMAKKTRNNLSSMLQDVLSKHETEIDFINGWVVSHGERLGLDVTYNKKVIELVKEGKILCDSDIETYFPNTNGADDVKLWQKELEDLAHESGKKAVKGLYNEHGICIQAW